MRYSLHYDCAREELFVEAAMSSSALDTPERLNVVTDVAFAQLLHDTVPVDVIPLASQLAATTNENDGLPETKKVDKLYERLTRDRSHQDHAYDSLHVALLSKLRAAYGSSEQCMGKNAVARGKYFFGGVCRYLYAKHKTDQHMPLESVFDRLLLRLYERSKIREVSIEDERQLPHPDSFANRALFRHHDAVAPAKRVHLVTLRRQLEMIHILRRAQILWSDVVLPMCQYLQHRLASVPLLVRNLYLRDRLPDALIDHILAFL